MNIWPWTAMRLLRVELRAARLSCAARTKQVNRLTARVQTLDRACAKHHAQAARDQAYIDELEERMPEANLLAARSAVTTGHGEAVAPQEVALSPHKQTGA